MAVRTQLRRAVLTVPTPGARSFHPAAVRTLVTHGPVVHLYGRQHIDLLRVAGALCRR